MSTITPPERSAVGTIMLGTQQSSNEEFFFDLATGPHTLVAGQTGSGKSVLINQIITQLMGRQRREVGLWLCDPSGAEFSTYEDCQHLLGKIANDVDACVVMLDNAIEEMELRFNQLEKAGVRSLDSYITSTGHQLVRIFVIIDDFGDLMLQDRRRIEPRIVRLAQKSRAVGIHLILATQRPSRDVVTGLIQANFPTRICMQVTSAIESRIVLGPQPYGAEEIRKKGDFLFQNAGMVTRLHCPFISDEEIEEVALRNRPFEYLETIQSTMDRTNIDDVLKESYAIGALFDAIPQRGAMIPTPSALHSSTLGLVNDAVRAAAPGWKLGSDPDATDAVESPPLAASVPRRSSGWEGLGKVFFGILLVLAFFVNPLLVFFGLIAFLIWHIAQKSAYESIAEAERARIESDRPAK